jgi:hypothetical protein
LLAFAGMETKPVTIRMPQELLEKLQQLAYSETRSLTGQIVYMLRRQIEEERASLFDATAPNR